MQDDKWEPLKEELERKFKVIDTRIDDLYAETQNGPVVSGRVEIIEFETPLGLIKLERESRPVVLEKKEFYSHQQNKSARTEYKFSETEFSHKIKAYKWDNYEEVWREMDAEAFGSK
jgi:hypothetical protein